MPADDGILVTDLDTIVTPAIIKHCNSKSSYDKDDVDYVFKSDHIINGSHHLHILLSMIFNIMVVHGHTCCCLPTPMALASGGSPMFPLVVHQPASPSIWPAVQSLRRGLSTNPGATMWCVCGCI